MDEVLAALATSSSSSAALAVVCVQDMRRRDALLRMLIHDVDVELRHAAENSLTEALTLCAQKHRPAVATVVAGLAWQRGDGAGAQECLQLALDVDPSYSLARLLARAIRSAVPPTVWVDAVAATSVESCLAGV